jgi:2-isopropylmalate synthase
MPDLREILFNDITLRDGEQCPGVNFLPKEKLRVAEQLVALNVPIVEAGFAVSSGSDFEGINLISRELGQRDGPIICSMARAVRKDIQRAAEALAPAARPRIQVVLSTSDIHLEKKLNMSRAKALEVAADAVSYAKTFVEDVEFAAEDATRTDLSFLHQIFEVALEAGASTLEIPDTVGYATPDEYGAIVRSVLDNVSGAKEATIATHCHDDLGLATANTLAGLAAGAGQAECTINGIGERAGNAPFEEVIMAIKTRPSIYGVAADIDTTHLYETSQVVRDLSTIVVAPNKAIIGSNAFRHESGIHQHGMLANSETYQIIEPSSVGANAFELRLGKLSGKHALMQRLSELGLKTEPAAFEKIYEGFKDLAGKKKLILDEDLVNLVNRYGS